MNLWVSECICACLYLHIAPIHHNVRATLCVRVHVCVCTSRPSWIKSLNSSTVQIPSPLYPHGTHTQTHTHHIQVGVQLCVFVCVRGLCTQARQTPLDEKKTHTALYIFTVPPTHTHTYTHRHAHTHQWEGKFRDKRPERSRDVICIYKWKLFVTHSVSLAFLPD